MRILKNLFFGVNVLLILFTLLSYLTPYFDPENIWQFTFLGLGYPYLFLANVLFVLFWVFLKRWYFLFSLIALLIGYKHVLQHININFADSPPNKNEIYVMSYNVKFMDYIFGEKKSERNKQDFFNFFETPKLPDILCLQEIGARAFKMCKENFAYPYSTTFVYKYNVIFSKYPIIDAGEFPFGETFNSCGWADIDVNGQIYRVYSAHLESTKVSIEANNLAERKELSDKENLSDMKSMAKKIKSSVQRRTKQAKQIVAHMEKSPYPIIFFGDFNDTPLSYTYQLLSANLKDTFQEKGHGLATTFGGVIPALRIDYILTDPKIQVLNHKTHKIKFSDHYPISSRLVLP